MGGSSRYRIAASMALVSALALAWLMLGVGLIGEDGDRANAMYLVVVAIGLAGSVAVRFRPDGMARVMLAMAGAQAAIAAIAVVLRLGHPASGPMELIGVNGMFVVLFVGSARLFTRVPRS